MKKSFFMTSLIFFSITSTFVSLPIVASDKEEEKQGDIKLYQQPKEKLSDKKSGKDREEKKEQETQSIISQMGNLDLNETEISRNNKKGFYFPKEAILKFSGIEISSPNNSIFEKESPLNAMGYFLRTQVLLKDKSWSRNHLTSSVFVIVEQEEHPRIIEGMILAKKDVSLDNEFYNFYSYPNQMKSRKNKLVADFMSSEVDKELHQKIVAEKYLPISTPSFKPINDKDSNHGDRLALDTFSTNYDLFFNLIKKTAHREDLPVLGMGMKYYSSFDACNECFNKIYSAQNDLGRSLYNFAGSQGYNIKKGEEKLPLFSLFYSDRPFKEVEYSVKYSNKEWNSLVAANWQRSYELGKNIVAAPKYPNPNLHPLYQFGNVLEGIEKLGKLTLSEPFNPESIFLYVDKFEGITTFYNK